MEKNDVLHIICDMCHRSLPYTEFPSKSKIGTGKTIICKGCVNIKNSKQPKLDEIPLFGAYKNAYVGAGNLEFKPDEVFMKIVKAPKYYVSNYGRVIQKGSAHDYEVEPEWRNGKLAVKVHTAKDRFYLSVDKLVAEAFLKKDTAAMKIVWHLDNDELNCESTNLIYVNIDEYCRLVSQNIKIDKKTAARQVRYRIPSPIDIQACHIYRGIKERCRKDIDTGSYKDAQMSDEWANDRNTFIQWYQDNYYECDGESMAVDKDLLYPGNKLYAKERCVILPQALNSMLANCKKHKLKKAKASNELPLGVRYDHRLKTYYGVITPCGSKELLQLSHWDTPDEAFAEYREYKLMEIRKMAEKYKGKVPDKVYQALLKVDVIPYTD